MLKAVAIRPHDDKLPRYTEFAAGLSKQGTIAVFSRKMLAAVAPYTPYDSRFTKKEYLPATLGRSS